MGKGVTLTKEELEALRELLEAIDFKECVDNHSFFLYN
jgi:hypothetical protein